MPTEFEFDVFISYFFVHPLTSVMAGWKFFEKPVAIGVRLDTVEEVGEVK